MSCLATFLFQVYSVSRAWGVIQSKDCLVKHGYGYKKTLLSQHVGLCLNLFISYIRKDQGQVALVGESFFPK